MKIGWVEFKFKSPPINKMPKDCDFYCNIHNHSEYSTLDAISRIERGMLSLDLDSLYEDQVTLVRRAFQLKQPGVGLTDHGALGGFFRFHTECVNHKINPIIGIEFYVIDSLKNLKDKDRDYSHLTALATSYAGLVNLYKLNKIAWTEGFYYKPKVDYEILAKYNKDIIMLSGCSANSPYLNIIHSDKSTKEKERLYNDLTRKFLDIYEDNFYMEIMPHGNYENAILLNTVVIDQALKHDILIVATNDSHYPIKEHSESHEVMLCIQVNQRMNDQNHWKFGDGELYLKSRSEIYNDFRKFHSYIPKEIINNSLDNTMVINTKVHIEIPKRTSGTLLPKPRLFGMKRMEYVNKLINHGWEKRKIINNLILYSEKNNIDITIAKQHYLERIEKELGIINKLGYIDYFLIVYELINYCRSNNLMVGPGRGSAAGSLFCYLLGITSIDPMIYELMFERFMSIYKTTCPDIDIDFDWLRRHEVFDWLEKRFGTNNFAHIGTYMILKGKAVVRDVGRVYSIPLNEVNIMTKNIIARSGGDERKSMTVSDSFDAFDIMRDFDKKYPFIRKHTSILEGTSRNCVVGSTKIRTNRKTQLSDDSFERTIEHLYKYYKRFNKLPKLRVFNGEFFVYKKAKNIWYAGIKDVYKVTCGNKKIICTDGERFLTKNGYIALKDLNICDYVFINNTLTELFLVKIDDIEYIGERKTYDIEIDTNNEIEKNYLANGFVVHNSGVHACGVIVSDQDLTNVIPIETRGSKGSGKKRTVVSALTGKENEKMGLLKLDILGLKTLTIISKACEMIIKNYDIEFNIEEINLEDKEILDEYTNLHYIGVFQFDSIGMKNAVEGFKFKEFQDVISWNALYRPGPTRSGIASLFKNRSLGLKKIPKIHDVYDRITAKTRGCILFQEQISQVFAEMANYNLADADDVRVVVAKSHGKDALGKHRDNFIKGCSNVNFGKEKAGKLFNQIVMFGCVVGETIIHKASSNQYSGKEITIKDLYEKNKSSTIFHQIKKIMSLDENENTVKINDILDIYYSGKKKVYKIETESGKFGLLTKEHKIKVENDYKKLKDLKVGDYILVTDFEKDYKTRLEKIKLIKYIGIRDTYDIAMESPNNNYVINNGLLVHNSYGFNKCLVYDSKIVRASSNSLESKEIDIGSLYERWNSNTSVGEKYRKFGLKIMFYDETDGRIRIDKVKNVFYNGYKPVWLVKTKSGKMLKTTDTHEFVLLNSNKIMKDLKIGDKLLVSDLKYEERYSKGYSVYEDEIILKKFSGIEKTYDLEMENENHNYVANNIVVHNSHAAAYSVISYWCMWLKHYYPLQFLSSALAEEKDDNKIRSLIKECVRLKIKVKNPDINLSRNTFYPNIESNSILCGFVDIKGIGDKAANNIVVNQPYDNIFDFIDKVERRCVNIRVIRSLCLADVFDCWCTNTKLLYDHLSEIVNCKSDLARKKYFKLFKEWSKSDDKWTDEEAIYKVRQVLSLPTVKHPILYYQKVIDKYFPHLLKRIDKISDIVTEKDVVNRYAVGVTIDIKYNQVGDFDKVKPTEKEIAIRMMKFEKQGARYVNFDLEDETGFRRFHVHPVIYERTRKVFEKGINTPIIIKYRILGGKNVINVEEVVDLQELSTNYDKNNISLRLLADHPLSNINWKKAKAKNILPISMAKQKSKSIIFGIIHDLRYFKIKTGDMAFAKVTDHEKSIDCLIWPDAVEKYKDFIEKSFIGRIVLLMEVEKMKKRENEKKFSFNIVRIIKFYKNKA